MTRLFLNGNQRIIRDFKSNHDIDEYKKAKEAADFRHKNHPLGFLRHRPPEMIYSNYFSNECAKRASDISWKDYDSPWKQCAEYFEWYQFPKEFKFGWNQTTFCLYVKQEPDEQ